MTEFISKWKWLILALAVVIGTICFTLLAGSGWAFTRLMRTPTPAIEPVSFGYCGARLTELCVVSFGRDAFGNGIVNLHVPRMRYPAFYLQVVRKSGEDRFECVWNKDVETSVYCSGAPLILGEGLEIQIHASLDDRLLAQGIFTLTAFLVPTPVIGDVSETSSATPQPGETPATATENPFGSAESMPADSKTPTPDATSSPSYPNYP